MFQPMTIRSLCDNFFVVLKDHVHEEHMKHARDAPFLGCDLQGTIVD